MWGANLLIRRKLLALLVLFATMLCVPAPAAAQSVKLATCILKAQPNDRTEQMLFRAASFDCASDQSQLQPGDYWVRMPVPQSTEIPREGLIFRTASLWDKGFELWAVHNNGQIEHYRPFEKQAINPMRLGATMVVPLRQNDAPVAMLLAKVKSSGVVRGVMLQSQLSSSESAITFEMALAVLYAGFVGLCIALLTYNIALHGRVHIGLRNIHIGRAALFCHRIVGHRPVALHHPVAGSYRKQRNDFHPPLFR
jgi:hypothetical protein